MPTIQEFSTKDKIELSSLVLTTTSELIDNSNTLIEMLDMATATGNALKVIKVMKLLSKVTAFIGAAGAALDIVMMFMPSEADEIISQIETLQTKLDTIFIKLGNDLENKYSKIRDTVQYSGFDEARTRIAHAEHVIDNYMANYGALFNGFISAQNSNDKNVLKAIYNNPASICKLPIDTSNPFFLGSNDLSQCNALKGFTPMLFSRGVNTFYFRCTGSGSSKGFLGAFNSFIESNSVITPYVTGDASWKVLGTDAPIGIEEVINSTDWKAPDASNVTTPTTSWTTPDAAYIPAINNAKWIWADSKFNNVWIKCTFFYNPDVYQYFNDSPQQYIVNSCITCNGTINEIYTYAENTDNLFPAVVLQPTNLKYNSFRVRPTFMTSYIEKSDTAAYSKLTPDEQQLQENIKNQVLASLLPNEGRNTLYLQCQNNDANTVANLIASFSTFINSDQSNIYGVLQSDATDSFAIQTNNSNNQLYVLSSATELQFVDVLKSTSWEKATVYTAAANASTATTAANKPNYKLPESNASWVWASDPKAQNVWFMWRYEYNANAHQNIEKYFRQISKANIENFITDDLADSIVGIFVNFLNFDESRKEGVLDMIFRESFASPLVIENLAAKYMQIIQRGIKALTFLRVMREQIVFLKEHNADKAYELTAANQKLLDQKMNNAQFGVTELFNSSIENFNLSSMFDARLTDVLSTCYKRDYFEPEAIRFIEKYIIENETLINNTIAMKTKGDGGGYVASSSDEDDNINSSLSNLILEALNAQYDDKLINWTVIVLEDLSKKEGIKSICYGYEFSNTGILCGKTFTSIEDRILVVVAKNAKNKPITNTDFNTISETFSKNIKAFSAPDYLSTVVPKEVGGAIFWYWHWVDSIYVDRIGPWKFHPNLHSKYVTNGPPFTWQTPYDYESTATSNRTNYRLYLIG